MTIASENKRNDYTGDNTTATHPYTFKILTENDIKVTQRNTSDVETVLVLNTDYTVTGAGTANGGTIVLTAGNLATGYHLTIRRQSQRIQETEIRNQGDFYPESHEDAFDHFISVDQSQQDEIDRCIKIPETYPDLSPDLPAPVAGKVLKVNDAGTAWTLVDPGDVTLAVPADDSVTGAKIDDSAIFVFPTLFSWQKGADVAPTAGVLTLGIDGNIFDVTGTDPITSIASVGVGTFAVLQFDAALVFTHHATDLIIQGGESVTTSAGNHALIYEYALGKWQCFYYSGSVPLLAANNTFSGANTFSGLVTLSKVLDSGLSIVDEGDNTKKIAFQASGITTGNTRTITMPDKDLAFDYGLVVPVATAVTNLDSITAGNAFYTKVGNIVHVSGDVTVDATTAGIRTTFRVALPIASNLGAVNSLAGSGSEIKFFTSVSSVAVFADGTNDEAQFEYFPVSATGTVSIFYTYSYKVVA